jgi:hypothetical protein
MNDAFLSAFSVFFTQSPSFLDYQTRTEKVHGKNNAQSIFGIHKIPRLRIAGSRLLSLTNSILPI